MDRETVQLETPISKTPFKLKARINTRERNALRSVAHAHAAPIKVDVKSGEAAGGTSEIDLGIQEDLEKEFIKQLVASLGEETDPNKILDTLLNGDPADYDFVVKSAQEISVKKNI